MNSHRDKFNRAFNHFIKTGEVLPGYSYFDNFQGMKVQPRFQSKPFTVEGVDYKFIKTSENGKWMKRAFLATPTDHDYN